MRDLDISLSSQPEECVVISMEEGFMKLHINKILQMVNNL